ncbi:uncharacterized protein LTR77_011069 [Saxophila tyrrhenica]|uniref:CipC-like antibiotic response protein n=1 Tax=Saxophila tyrrhenica TaxID=1690608 RepID=A0AAV9NTH9_9PEZI|nr:hypothetical protein LTR77_011069 [Saxophila tyrrhenica]
MFGWDDAHDDYKKTQNPENKAELSHEVLAGGASFMAMKEWEDHQRKEGKEVDHAFAKEAIAAIAGVEVDRLAETKGADYIDREKTKHEAKKRSEALYDQHYGEDENYNPHKKHPHKKIQQEFGGY